MNEWEKRNCDFQFYSMDRTSFFGMIISAIYKADPGNTARMRLAFPELVESIVRWRSEDGYAQKLEEEYRGMHHG